VACGGCAGGIIPPTGRMWLAGPSRRTGLDATWETRNYGRNESSCGKTVAERAVTGGRQPPAPLVLLVEDDVAVRSTLAAILHDEGCDMIIAPNGFDALVSLEQHNPDIIVLDWMMPVVDGEHFLQALREEYHSTTPVLVISAGRVGLDTAMESGADAYLQKPFDIDELMEVLTDLVERSRLSEDEQTEPDR
jgi:CheY-like chemotaxis protein